MLAYFMKPTSLPYEVNLLCQRSRLHRAMKTLSFSGGCLYVLQTLIAHSVMVAYYVVALVELWSDVGGGVDELIGVCGV
jgi:hypothetical protein